MQKRILCALLGALLLINNVEAKDDKVIHKPKVTHTHRTNPTTIIINSIIFSTKVN